MKNMTEGDATTQYNFTFDNNPPDNEPPVKDYARTEINPDDACDVKIKWPSTYAISVGTGYCVADKTDNVNDYYTPYDFLPYTEDGFPDFDYPLPTPDGKTLNELIAQGCTTGTTLMPSLPPYACDKTKFIEIDPLGITPAYHFFQWARGYGGPFPRPPCPTPCPYIRNNVQSSGVRNYANGDVSPSRPDFNRLPYYPFNTDNFVTINPQSALPSQSSTVGTENNLKATYSLSVRIFLQIINWYMAEFTYSINNGFWSELTAYENAGYHFLVEYQPGDTTQICQGIDTKHPEHSTEIANRPCIAISSFGDRIVQTALLRTTAQGSLEGRGVYNTLYTNNAFKARTFSKVTWPNEISAQPICDFNSVNYNRICNGELFEVPFIGNKIAAAMDFRSGSLPLQFTPNQESKNLGLGENPDGYSKKLAWKDADDVGDAFGTVDDGIPSMIIKFFAESAAINQNKGQFPGNGFNASSLFPAIYPDGRKGYPNSEDPNYPWQIPRGGERRLYCPTDDATRINNKDCDLDVLCINNAACLIGNGGDTGLCQNRELENLAVSPTQLTPAFFNFPDHFVKPGEVWSLAYIGESGLWAVSCALRVVTALWYT